MTDHAMATAALDWRPMSEMPTREGGDYLVFSACDGYHVMCCHPDGQLCSYGDSTGEYPATPEKYVAWAALPDSPWGDDVDYSSAAG